MALDPIFGDPQSGFWMPQLRKLNKVNGRSRGLKSTPARKLLINATIGFQTKPYKLAENSWSQSKDH